ncbi:hypothetical protein BC831DRAFT_491350 [Entophlyctis helioformis]|nr:hypothetical protein BC831DRAFT_491350 [Entophlyctis helioformis]
MKPARLSLERHEMHSATTSALLQDELLKRSWDDDGPSAFFSADRHYARTARQPLRRDAYQTSHESAELDPAADVPSQSRTGACRTRRVVATEDGLCANGDECGGFDPYGGTSSLAHVQSMLSHAALMVESSSDPLAEARSLLDEWSDTLLDGISADDTAEYDTLSSAVGDDVSSIVIRRLARLQPADVQPTHAREEFARSAPNITDLVSDVVDRSCGTEGSRTGFARPPSDPRLSMAARQAQVRERKDLIERQRLLGLQSRISNKTAHAAAAAASQDARRVHPHMYDAGRLAMHARKLEDDSHVAGMAIEDAKQRLMAEQSRRQAAIDARVSTMVQLRQFRLLKTVITEWRRHVVEISQTLSSRMLVRSWQTLNRYWAKWTSVQRARLFKRRQAAIQHELEHQQANLVKAVMFHRSSTMSRAFLALRMGVQLSHETVLGQLEQKYALSEAEAKVQTCADVAPAAEPIKRDSTEPKQRLPFKPIMPKHSVVKPRIQPDTAFITAMQKRQQEREERRQQLAMQLRLKREKEEEQKREEERRKLEQEAAARQAMVEERRRLEQEARSKIAELEHKREQARQQLAMATEHYRKRGLLWYRGLGALQRAVRQSRSDELRAEAMDKQRLCRQAIREWFARVKDRWKRDEATAMAVYRSRALAAAVAQWRQVRVRNEARRTAACMMSNARLLRTWYGAWRNKYGVAAYHRDQHIARQNRIADVFARRAVPRRYLQRWKQFVQLQKDDRWRAYQRSQLQAKVASILSESRLQSTLDSAFIEISGTAGGLSTHWPDMNLDFE